jgi:hypothetical protein
MKRMLACFFLCAALGVCWGQGYQGTRMLVPGDTGYTAIDSTKGTAQDSLRQKKQRKLKVVKREFSYRQKIGLAIAIMACMAFIITTAQSWNPQ